MEPAAKKPWLLYLSIGVLLGASLFWGPRLWALYHHGAQDACISNLKQIDQANASRQQSTQQTSAPKP